MLRLPSGDGRRRVLAALCLLCFGAAAAADAAATLDLEAQARVRAATFEIVMKKPEKDSLTYEKPLPLELLPYTERTDKYISIGTAFAIGEGRYITAAHVLESGLQTQFGEPALRTADGVVHALDRIHKYSSAQDFVVFSVQGGMSAAALPVNREPTLNTAVFAVGNALGEGIVIRDGLYTSQTPEQHNGQWQWIRFSAAASPGNSGGPLLDAQGRVIGIVLRKSENENLNYAAPISLILDAPGNTAKLLMDGYFYLPVMDQRESGREERSIPLPKSFAQLAADIVGFRDDFYAGLKAALLSRNAAEIFPQGEGSTQLLHVAAPTDSLLLISRKDDGTWDAFRPDQIQTATLPQNGYVAYGDLAGVSSMKIRRPDGQPTDAFYSDSKLYADTLLQAIRWTRQVGREEVRITSFGKAREESLFVDAYGRKWQLRFWDIEYLDSVLISLALPTPDGYLALVRPTTTANVTNVLDDLHTMTSFALASYTGTLEQWQGYLAHEELLPAVFDDIEIEVRFGEQFRFTSPRIDFPVPDSLQKIEPGNLLTINFSYFRDGDAVVWDAAGLVLADKIAGTQAVVFARHARPPASLPQIFGARWEKMSAREFPYNAVVIDSPGSTHINAIYPFPASADALPADDAVRYEIGLARQGKHTQEDLRSALERLAEGVNVME